MPPYKLLTCKVLLLSTVLSLFVSNISFASSILNSSINNSSISSSLVDSSLPIQSFSQINFQLSANKVLKEKGLTVTIPPKLFNIWKLMRQQLDFEVGGGLDFNINKELERIKLSYGQSKSVSYLPDFEVSWHTHPGVGKKGVLALISPPSPADIKNSIKANYNHWLLTSGNLNDDFSNIIIMTSFSHDKTQPLAVEVSIVVDEGGVYLYRANKQYWQPIWQQGAKITNNEGSELKDKLQAIVNKNYHNLQQGKVTIDEARKAFILDYQQTAHIFLNFYSWEEVLSKGLNINLEAIELIAIKRG